MASSQKSMVLSLLLGLAAGLAVAQSSTDTSDNVPATLVYDGYLENASVPETQTVDLGFALFDAPTDGVQLWPAGAPEVKSVTPSGGRFSVVLGEGEALPDAVFDSPAVYVEVSVGTSTLSPRQQVISHAFARKAGVATSAVQAQSAIPGSALDDQIAAGVRYATKTLDGGANQYRDETTGFVDDEDPNFRWNNLVVGKTYVVSGAFDIRDSTFAPNPYSMIIEIENGGTNVGFLYLEGELANEAASGGPVFYRTAPFVAVDTFVRFNVVENTLARIVRSGTFTTIEELGHHSSTTSFD